MHSLEHGLIILLLLVGLLNAKVLRGYWWFVLGAILGLAMIAPVYPLPLPWSWLAALAIPLLFWQTAYRMVRARWTSTPAELGLWVLLALTLTAALWWVGGIALTGAILFSILIASMSWRATELEDRSTYLGQIGALALAFLLAEIRTPGEMISRYLYELAGGAFIGSLTGYFTARLAEKVSAGWKRNMISLAQGYFAYGLALLLGVSPVAATIISIVVYIDIGLRRRLWEAGQVTPRPLANRAVFVALLAALAFFAWQTHIPISVLLLVDLLIVLAVVAFFVTVGRRLNFPSLQTDRPLLNVLLRVSFLVPPALLAWPRAAFLEPEPIAIALLSAALVILVTFIGVSPLLNLYTSMENRRSFSPEADNLFARLRVDDLLVTEFPAAAPDTVTEELTRLLAANENACLPVIDREKRLLGMITPADLFFKEQSLPRSSISFVTLFGEAVLDDLMIAAYIESSGVRRAVDLMTSQVLWVEQGTRADEAIRLMISSRLHCLPVMTGDPKAGGLFVGLFTRSNLIRSLSDKKRVNELRSMLVERGARGE